MSGVPAAILDEVQSHLGGSGTGSGAITSVRPVGGGCISPCARVETGGRSAYFLKWAGPGGVPTDFFAAESRSLEALADSGVVRVPEVCGVAERWLLLDWLEPARPAREGWARLGRALAALHDVPADGFGWPVPNYIGSLPQANEPAPTWGAFWRERRLAPQLERALRAGHFATRDRRRFERVLLRLDALLDAGDADGPSLLHGDLWSGNVHFTSGGEAALIDPSSYRGHGEVDLAMAELFGGFDRPFFDAYREVRPVRPGYEARRRPIYQLYYLLVHVNLFGRGYVSGCLSALASAESAA